MTAGKCVTPRLPMGMMQRRVLDCVLCADAPASQTDAPILVVHLQLQAVVVSKLLVLLAQAEIAGIIWQLLGVVRIKGIVLNASVRLSSVRHNIVRMRCTGFESTVCCMKERARLDAARRGNVGRVGVPHFVDKRYQSSGKKNDDYDSTAMTCYDV
jgi:hypothetical protein